MEGLKSILVAASGMKAQNARMRVIAQNLANANSAADAPGQDPYRRQIPSFKSFVDRDAEVSLVEMSKTLPDNTPFRKKFNPGHPAADEMGYIQLPNVNSLVEIMDMKEAQQSYEANLNIIKSTQGMLSRTLDLLRS